MEVKDIKLKDKKLPPNLGVFVQSDGLDLLCNIEEAVSKFEDRQCFFHDKLGVMVCVSPKNAPDGELVDSM
jgi:hypothetical protein